MRPTFQQRDGGEHKAFVLHRCIMCAVCSSLSPEVIEETHPVASVAPYDGPGRT